MALENQHFPGKEINIEPLRLDIDGIHQYQRNRPPYLFVDFAEVVPGKTAKGFRDLKPDEWFFECHFPGDPNMPGMLQIEALVQLCALTLLTLPGNKGEVAYLISATNQKWKRKVLPGERFTMETVLLSFERGLGKCRGSATVNGEPACESEFVLVLPHVLKTFTVRKPIARGEPWTS